MGRCSHGTYLTFQHTVAIYWLARAHDICTSCCTFATSTPGLAPLILPLALPLTLPHHRASHGPPHLAPLTLPLILPVLLHLAAQHRDGCAGVAALPARQPAAGAAAAAAAAEEEEHGRDLSPFCAGQAYTGAGHACVPCG